MSGWKGYCNGAGHKGGAKSYRVCPECGIQKANTAFRAIGKRGGPRSKGAAPLGAVCMKCEGTTSGRETPRNLQHDYSKLSGQRMPFDAWMQAIRATHDEHVLVRRAVERYGMRSPCPDDLLEEAAGHDRRRFGKLWHAVVLLAIETQMAGRQGTYNLTPRVRKSRRRADSESRSAA